MAAAIQLPDFVIGPVGDKRLQFGRVEEVLTNVGTIFGLKGLVLAIAQIHHALLQNALGVALEQCIPMRAPDQLDHIPAGTAEFRFQILNDFAVAAHRAIQTLQVTVDHEDQVVEFFATGHTNGTERFHFVGLAIAKEGPNLTLCRFFSVNEVAARQVFHEARLVDRLNRT